MKTTTVSYVLVAITIIIMFWYYFSAGISFDTSNYKKVFISEILKENSYQKLTQDDTLLKNQLDSLTQLIAGAKPEIISSEAKKEEYFKEKYNHSEQTFWIKVIFSTLFTLTALYVVLSKKYDEETKKWAFGVLTLISGVWIGSIT